MKRWNIMTIGMLLILGFVGHAQAIRRGDQGVGAMIGNPTGFSYKYWLTEDFAMDGAAGVNQSEFDIHATFLFHNFETTKRWAQNSSVFKSLTDDGEMPWYFGVGPRLLLEDKSEFGLRFPIGFSYLPHNSVWEIFTEFAPVLRLTPDTGFDGDFAIGARYYFPAIRPRAQ